MKKDLIGALIAWFDAQCDGDWEHVGGIRIKTLGNPGWSLTVGLPFESEDKKLIKVERSATDWLCCYVEQEEFRGAAGPENLEELIEYFLSFVGER